MSAFAGKQTVKHNQSEWPLHTESGRIAKSIELVLSANTRRSNIEKIVTVVDI